MDKGKEAVIKQVGRRRWRRNKGPRKSTNQVTLCLTERAALPVSRAQVNAELGLHSLKDTGHSGLSNISCLLTRDSQSTTEVHPLPFSWRASVILSSVGQIWGRALGIHSIHFSLLWSLEVVGTPMLIKH